MKKAILALAILVFSTSGANGASTVDQIAFERMIDRAQEKLLELIRQIPAHGISSGFGEFRTQILTGKIQLDLRQTHGHGGTANAASIFCFTDEKGKRKYGLGASYQWLLMPGLTDESRMMTLFHEFAHWRDYQIGQTEASLCFRGGDKVKEGKSFLLSELRANEAECLFGRSLGWDHPDKHCQRAFLDFEGFLLGVLRGYKVDDAEGKKLIAEYIQKKKK